MKTPHHAVRVGLLCGLATAAAGPAQAGVTTHTTYADFVAALNLAGLTEADTVLHDFNDVTAGTAINNDSVVDGLTFEDIVDGNGTQQTLNIVSDSGADSGGPTISTPNQVGQLGGSGNQMADGFGFTLSFPFSQAFAVYFQSSTPPGAIFEGDFSVTFGGSPQGSVNADAQQIGTTGTYTWFIGFVDDSANFDRAFLSSFFDSGTTYQFTIDNVITAPVATPAPASIALLILGLTGLIGLRRRP
jgi:hypothetical protein